MELSLCETRLTFPQGTFTFSNMRESLEGETCGKVQIALQEADREISVKAYFHTVTVCFSFLSSCIIQTLPSGHTLEVMTG